MTEGSFFPGTTIGTVISGDFELKLNLNWTAAELKLNCNWTETDLKVNCTWSETELQLNWAELQLNWNWIKTGLQLNCNWTETELNWNWNCTTNEFSPIHGTTPRVVRQLSKKGNKDHVLILSSRGYFRNGTRTKPGRQRVGFADFWCHPGCWGNQSR